MYLVPSSTQKRKGSSRIANNFCQTQQLCCWEPLTDKGKRTFEALSDLFKLPTRCAKPDYKRHAGTHADSSHQTPGGGSGAAGAAAIKDLLLLRRDKDPIGYDMPDFLDNDHTTMYSTYYAAATSPPLPTTDMPQAAGGKGKEPLTPHPNASTDTTYRSTRMHQVT